MDRSVHGSAWLDSETFVGSLAVDCPEGEFSDRMYQTPPPGTLPDGKLCRPARLTPETFKPLASSGGA
jgi:hypothetical protein